MKLLIIGSNGFVGKNLVSLLSSEMDIFMYGLSRSKFQQDHRNYSHFKGNLNDNNWSQKLKEKNEKIDALVYLAQSDQYRNFPDGASSMLDINSVGLLKLALWAKLNGIKKFIFASTGNVYKTKKTPLKENDKCEPNSFYGASKLAGELILKQFVDYFDIYILRIFGTYGPGQNDMLVPNIIQNIINHKKIILANGSGLYFNPVFIDDLILKIRELIFLPLSKKCVIFNVGGDDVISLDQLVSDIANFYKVNPNIKIIKKSPTYLIGDINKIKKSLGLTNKTSYKYGISRVLKSLENR